MGRPKEAVPRDLAESVLEHLADGQSLLSWCSIEGHPKPRTVYKWTEKDPAFRAEFERARVIGADILMERAQVVADDGSQDWVVDSKGAKVLDREHVQRSKLRCDVMLRRASNHCMQRVQVKGDKDNPIQVESKGPAAPETKTLAEGMAHLTKLVSQHLNGNG